MGSGKFWKQNLNLGAYTDDEITQYEKIIMFLGSKVRRVRNVDNFTAICEPIV
jgi:hypothetical protein